MENGENNKKKRIALTRRAFCIVIFVDISFFIGLKKKEKKHKRSLELYSMQFVLQQFLFEIISYMNCLSYLVHYMQ